MNVLPLISSFLLIFAIGSYSFFHSWFTTAQEREHFYGALQASHVYGRRLQTADYRKIPGKVIPLHDSATQSETAERTEYHSPRDRKHLYPEAKLNIAPLLAGDDPKLEQLFLKLVAHLYAHSPFHAEEVGTLFLTLFKQAKGIQSLHDLVGLAPEGQRELVYKILKGTQNYEIGKKSGYPALVDFVKLGKRGQQPVRICHAARPILFVLFGQTITDQLIEKEREKWEPEHQHHPITKEELQELLLPAGYPLVQIEELLSFAKSKQALEEEIIETHKLQIRHKR